MIIKTKKYQLDKKTYIIQALLSTVKEQLWYALIPVAILALSFFSWWFALVAFVVVLGYGLFWVVQFVGVTQMPDSKILFDKYAYEIDSSKIMVKLNVKQGMQINWDKIISATKTKEAYILYISKAQFFYMPFKIFSTESEMKFLDTILNRKGLIG